MSFTAEEIANINNAALEHYIEKGKVFKQNVLNKPMLKAFDEARKSFSGGNEYVSVGIKSGQGGGSLAGYTHDDQVSYYNPTSNKRAKYAWKEHHIGIQVSHSELKIDGVDISDDNSTSKMDGREEHVLANLLDEKLDDLGEDYAKSLDTLLHGDGTTDTKALAGIRALILDSPTTGTTGGVNRAVNTWWRNRAVLGTASAATNGGVLLQVLQGELRQLGKYAQGTPRWKFFAGSDFIGAMELELRANGNYTMDGFMNAGRVDGGMADVQFKGNSIIYDPTLDAISRAKYMYVIDMSKVNLYYMNGQRMKKHNPSRPYDRYVMYNGITTTAVLAAKQLNTSAVYSIN